MKKILIAAAIVCAAVVSQAAATSWKVTAAGLKGPDGNSYGSGVLTLIATGGDLEESVTMLSQACTSGTLSNYKFTVADGVLTAGQTYDIVYMLTANYGGKDYTLTSTTKSVAALSTGDQALNWGNQSTYTGKAAGNWVAAPEPTSGLLMLLGLGALALRRRRA